MCDGLQNGVSVSAPVRSAARYSLQRALNIRYIHRMEREADYSPEQLSAIKSAYEDFKKEAKDQKTAVKSGKSTVSEFKDWILSQLDLNITSFLKP